MRKISETLSLYGVISGILLFVIFLMSSVPIQAETESPQANVDQEVSTFSNPAQAAHAANLAAVVAQSDPNVQAAFATLEAAKIALQNAIASGNPSAIAQAQAAYDTAKANAQAALAQAAGVAVHEIAGMRSKGLGWGQIAHGLGVHPGVLGLGHTKGINAQPTPVMEMATARDMQTGLAKGHGGRTDSSSGGRGLGLGNAGMGHSGKGGSSGSSHGLGNASGSGGHGGGNGGGHGGGDGGGHGGGGGGGHGK